LFQIFYKDEAMLPPIHTVCRSEHKWDDLKRVAGLCFFCFIWCCVYLVVLGCLIVITFLVVWTNTTIDESDVANETARRVEIFV